MHVAKLAYPTQGVADSLWALCCVQLTIGLCISHIQGYRKNYWNLTTARGWSLERRQLWHAFIYEQI